MTFKPGDFGVSIFRGHDPMERPCANCPFVMEEQGKGYLQEERMENIKFASSMGQPFHCHKTVYRPGIEMIQKEDGTEEAPSWDRSYKQCAGANQYALKLAKELGITPTVIGKPFPPEA